MDKETGFKRYQRKLPQRRSVEERLLDYKEIYPDAKDGLVRQQAVRCMDCGVPFCHVGCPLGNQIPDWNNLVHQGRWKDAYDMLQATNNFPEFTGRLCPAPCETSCVLSINSDPVTIELIEKSIVEKAFSEGWIVARPPEIRTQHRVAVVGSGPAGLACADQLNRAGHTVTVFERDDRIGGLLRYGIPDFKMEKRILDRRIELLKAEGIKFQVGSDLGGNLPISTLDEYDATILCTGATAPRDLPLPGRELQGIHYAMDYLTGQNRICAGDATDTHPDTFIDAAGKHVIVIGGGDTASDCIGTASRQGALSVTNFDYHDLPPAERPKDQPWPNWPMVLRTSSSHEEGVDRQWKILTRKFVGEKGRVVGIDTVQVDLVAGSNGSRYTFLEHPDSEKRWAADLVLLAIGFSGPERGSLVQELDLELTRRGAVKTDDQYQTNVTGVFSAGDMRIGQSLIVNAISEGREAARSVDMYLTGQSRLPSKGQYPDLF